MNEEERPSINAALLPGKQLGDLAFSSSSSSFSLTCKYYYSFALFEEAINRNEATAH